MNPKFLLLFALPLLIIQGCSSSKDTATTDYEISLEELLKSLEEVEGGTESEVTEGELRYSPYSEEGGYRAAATRVNDLVHTKL